MNRNICHMTSIRNLHKIFETKSLLCKAEIQKQNIQFDDISNHDVQDKRGTTQVPLWPNGTLFDYVPFYFWGLTPMLLKNKLRQCDIVFFVTKPSKIQKTKQPFVFTDRHAILRPAGFSNNLNDLDKYLDMSIIKDRYWSNTLEHPDKKERKQAEFLIFKKVELRWCLGIVTINEAVKTDVEKILKTHGLSMNVKSFPTWYY